MAGEWRREGRGALGEPYPHERGGGLRESGFTYTAVAMAGDYLHL